MLLIVFDNIAEALHQRITGGDDITDEQSTVWHRSQLAVLYIQPADGTFFIKDTLTGQEADGVDSDMLTAAAFLQREIQRPSENRQDIGR